MQAMKTGCECKETIQGANLVLVRDDGGLEQCWRGADNKWSDSRYILQVRFAELE